MSLKNLKTYQIFNKRNILAVYFGTKIKLNENTKHIDGISCKKNYFERNKKNWLYGIILICSSIIYCKISDKKYWKYLQLNNYKISKCATKSSLPRYSREEVSKHKKIETGIWVTFGNKVYDVTQFISQHPGGDKILMAAGGPVEPFWNLYAVHKNNKEVLDLLSKMEIGELIEDDNSNKLEIQDPYSTDPIRHPALKVVCHKPFNAETPLELILENHITPNSLFFVRNHLPVPLIDISQYKLSLTGLGVKNEVISLDYNEIKSQKWQKNKIETTIMCAGNRRSDMSKYKPVHGLSWSQGAISNAEWTGILLIDLLKYYGITYENLMSQGVKYVQFEGSDKDPAGVPYGSSIPIEVALDPRSQVLLAYEMNGETLPIDHGYPIRVVIPGVIGARQVKWLSKIVFSTEESDSFWQQHDYKTFPVSIDVNQLDYNEQMPVMEPNVQSAICEPRDGQTIENYGYVTVKGYAWSGGGRGIIRVEVSSDGGESWYPAIIKGSKQPINSNHITRQQWSWVLWEVDILVEDSTKQMEFICKAVDSSQNTQPESYKGTWNVRGLMSNAWHKITVNFVDDGE